MRVILVEIGSASIRINSVGDLIITRLVKRAKIEPDFGDVGIDANSTRVGVKGIAELIDLVVEHANAAPERRIASVAVNGLLVGFVCFLVLGNAHVRPTEQIPTLGIGTIYKSTYRGDKQAVMRSGRCP